jgi:amino acid adenylation domain-containing protein
VHTSSSVTLAYPHLALYLENSAICNGSRVAVVDPSGDSWTFGQLNDVADAIAEVVQSQGVLPGDRIGIAMSKGSKAVAAMFGILKARAVCVPLDINSPSTRAAAILEDCGVGFLFTDAGLETVGGSTIADWTRLPRSPLQRPPQVPRPSTDLAYILYTSGSTGSPKGVMLTHQNAASFVEWSSSVFAPTANDRFSNHAPLHFDLSVLDVYLSIKHAASVHIISDDLSKNPRGLVEFIQQRKLTFWYSAPSILGLMAEFGKLERNPCATLRTVLFAGEVFPVKSLRLLANYWQHPAFYNLYGPTETNVCTFARIPSMIPDDRSEPFPIGWPCSHCSVRIAGNGSDEGALQVSGPSVFRGYWNRPIETRHCLSHQDGVTWYDTGDIVRSDPVDGFRYVGRCDRRIKRKGHRIELGDVETNLLRVPTIKEAAVVVLDDNNNGNKVVAFVTLSQVGASSNPLLKSSASKVLPLQMIPDEFVAIDTIPRTSTAKVDYQRLIELARRRE